MSDYIKKINELKIKIIEALNEHKYEEALSLESELKIYRQENNYLGE